MYTMKEFKRLCEEVPEAHVMACPGIQYCQEPGVPGQDVYWVRSIYKDVKKISDNELVPGTAYGYTFETFTANVPYYLAWLVKTIQELGGRIERGTFESIADAIEHYKEADTIVNCTGLGSYYLKDVQDHTMYPARGQTVVVRAPHIKTQHYIDGNNQWTYIIPRSDGTVICGGTLDRENRNTAPDDAITADILERCYKLCPEITHGKGVSAFDIVSINVGFRPGRTGGIRLEKETRRRSNGDKVKVCHNYGHSSHGYQSSWGSSAKLVELVKNERLSKL
ncbi:uncharacterized protein EV154DRAFT_492449 [Mucor mucedo]|uniref:uncharacterized protein n=1 Tax=Mucor mucedo TaxID=29922 RepID=UPI00221FFA1B|nr:uncharacterized protein EV154DRAFT_492449 [Mucor mucedo]KAI7896483.1 hypothetical protein EV154DRAFT_492449 [Mucor mucedo]